MIINTDTIVLVVFEQQVNYLNHNQAANETLEYNTC